MKIKQDELYTELKEDSDIKGLNIWNNLENQDFLQKAPTQFYFIDNVSLHKKLGDVSGQRAKINLEKGWERDFSYFIL